LYRFPEQLWENDGLSHGGDLSNQQCWDFLGLEISWRRNGNINGFNASGVIKDGNGKPSTLPSGKRLHNYGKSACLMGKSTISMAIFNSYVKLPEGKIHGGLVCWEHHRTRFSTLPCLITNGYFRQLFGRQPSDFCCFRFIVHAQISPVN